MSMRHFEKFSYNVLSRLQNRNKVPNHYQVSCDLCYFKKSISRFFFENIQKKFVKLISRVFFFSGLFKFSGPICEMSSDDAILLFSEQITVNFFLKLLKFVFSRISHKNASYACKFHIRNTNKSCYYCYYPRWSSV